MIRPIFSSISGSSTSSRPAKRPTTSAVRASAVGPPPPLVTITLASRSPMRRRAPPPPSPQPPAPLGGEVVGGRPEPAAGHDPVEIQLAHVAERALQILAPVPDHGDLLNLDPPIGEPFPDTRAVPCAH